MKRTRSLSLDLRLGRRRTDIYRPDERGVLNKWIEGRVYISGRDYNETGVAGLIELSRFSHLPICLILKYNIGRLIANRNYFELLQKEYVISDVFERRYEKHQNA